MSGKTSLIFPSRDERFLIPSIHDAFRNARGEFEVIAVIDSDKWPEGWKEVVEQYSPRLHTIFHGTPKGMRAAINSGVGSAISRGAKFIAKFDAHCSFSEGFDEVLKSACEPNWIVVPRRGRLDPEAWTATETHKPDIDYHYLSFPDDPQDFGGPGLNGKPWLERAVERAQYDLDDEMSSQGSGWFMHAAYFTELELMDEASYGPFWNEFQEIGLKCWLSGGKVMVNKKAKYLHLHKGKKYGRGYHLPEKWLQQGRTHANLWAFNEAWPKQTLPFEWLIDRFWPVPSWSENWREVLYATRKPRVVPLAIVNLPVSQETADQMKQELMESITGLRIHQARYGVLNAPMPFVDHSIDVTERVRSLVKNSSLDIVVNNSTLTPGQNPFRGKKKVLLVNYSIDGGDSLTSEREEKDWLIIGPAMPQRAEGPYQIGVDVATGKDRSVIMSPEIKYEVHDDEPQLVPNLWPKSIAHPPTTAPALNDYLIRRFQISPQRLRGPMPIELRDFHRNDLAQLFAELGFKRGAEIGVAEGNYSEIICKANPEVELFCVDPWYAYPANPQGKTSERHEFAYNETKRKLEGYNAHLIRKASIDAEREFDSGSLDFVYVDGNHLYDFVSLDLILWSNKVRSGGVISGDDYMQLDQKRWVGGGVVEAVQAYVNAHRIGLWFICNAHRSTDYFWVKP